MSAENVSIPRHKAPFKKKDCMHLLDRDFTLSKVEPVALRGCVSDGLSDCLDEMEGNAFISTKLERGMYTYFEF